MLMTNKFLCMIEMKLLLGFIHDTGPPTPAPPTCIVWTTFLCFIYIFISTRLTGLGAVGYRSIFRCNCQGMRTPRECV